MSEVPLYAYTLQVESDGFRVERAGTSVGFPGRREQVSCFGAT